MTVHENMIDPLDYWHHKFLLGHSDAKPMLEKMLKVGIKENCPKAIKYAENIKKGQSRTVKDTPSVLFKRYDMQRVSKVVSPLYNYLLGYIVMMLLIMILTVGGFNVI